MTTHPLAYRGLGSGESHTRAILNVIAIAKGLRTHGRFLVKYSEDELLDIESRAGF